MIELLVVAGEQSGDRAAASVLAALRAGGADVSPFGLGGGACEAQGMELVSDLRDSTALGVGDVAVRAYGIARAWLRVAHAAMWRRARAALLVNYTEFNTLLAAKLHARGVRVLWYGAPQIWAWRARRAEPLRRTIDRMALMLPFEEQMWRERGVDAHYVGHPAVETTWMDRVAAREAMGLTPYARTVAILPGSRPHEVERLLGPMLEAYERVRSDRASIDGRVLLAPSLDEGTRARALARAAAMSVEVIEMDARVGAAPCLRAFDAALCASGTAALEAALARATPIVVYRVDKLTEIAARRLLHTSHIALPNVLLGEAAFPELLQREAHPKRIAQALARAIDARSTLVRACDRVAQALGDKATPSRDVARMLAPWLTA
jgi:lipid-A-disaccharide synthase